MSDVAQGRSRTRGTCGFNYYDVTTPCTNIEIRVGERGGSYFVIFKSRIIIIFVRGRKQTQSDLTAFIKLSRHRL